MFTCSQEEKNGKVGGGREGGGREEREGRKVMKGGYRDREVERNGDGRMGERRGGGDQSYT